MCLRAKGPSARETAAERLQRVTASLHDFGLTDTEIALIQVSGVMLGLEAKPNEIRGQLTKK